MDKEARITAVIVDDEALTRLDFSQMLHEMGIDVVGEAGDGFDAVEICRKFKPDIVLMDLRMPVFDGYGATDLIIKEEIADIVIVVTAYDDVNMIKRALQSGVSHYLVKPVNFKDLFIAVHTSLVHRERMRRLQSQLEKAQLTLQEQKLIDRAKAKLSSEKNISEAEAYRIIQKTAMNKQISMRQIASHLLAAGDDNERLQRAKHEIMRSGNLSEKQAFKRIQTMAEEHDCSLAEAVDDLLSRKEK